MQVVKNIDSINMGDNFSTSSGLELLVSNTGFVQNTHILAPVEILTLQEQIAKKIATLTYFTIAQSTITSGIVDAQ
jgi:spore maturation protein SpmA